MIALNVLADNLVETLMFDDEELPPKISTLANKICGALYWQAAKESGELFDYLDKPLSKRNNCHNGRKD